MPLSPSVHPSFDLGQKLDGNSKGTVVCGSEMKLSWGFVKSEREMQNMIFGRASSIHSLFQGHSPGGRTCGRTARMGIATTTINNNTIIIL